MTIMYEHMEKIGAICIELTIQNVHKLDYEPWT
jgi:hypothetical protein